MYRRLKVFLASMIVSTWLGVGPVSAQSAPPSCAQSSTVTLNCMYGLPTIQYLLLLGKMLSYPTPNVQQVDVDTAQIRRYSLYRAVGQQLTFFDAPNGTPIGTQDAGFNYFAVRKIENGWAELKKGKWVQAENLKFVRASSFAGVLVDQPLEFPFAWVLQPTPTSTYPGQPPADDAPVLNRYTRVNIFTTVIVDGWEWYLVGPGQWLEQRRVARIMPHAKPEGTSQRWVAVDLFEQVLVAYEGDQPVFATLISSGLPGWSTNEGLFKVWVRMRNDTMSGAMGRPDFYYLESVPYVMYFDHAIGLHGSYWHDGYGYRRSHGCVNLSISDARWVYEWSKGTEDALSVLVWSSGTYD